MTKAHQSFADLIGFEAEVGGIEFFVKAWVAHADIDEDTLARQNSEQVSIGLGVHDMDWFCGLVFV